MWGNLLANLTKRELGSRPTTDFRSRQSEVCFDHRLTGANPQVTRSRPRGACRGDEPATNEPARSIDRKSGPELWHIPGANQKRKQVRQLSELDLRFLLPQLDSNQ